MIKLIEENIGDNLCDLGLGRFLRNDTKGIIYKKKKLVN